MRSRTSARQIHQVITRIVASTPDRRFAAVLRCGSRVAVLIGGRLERGDKPAFMVSGQIDRLVLDDSEAVIVADNTPHTSPLPLTEAPPGDGQQFAFYRGLVSSLLSAARAAAGTVMERGRCPGRGSRDHSVMRQGGCDGRPCLDRAWSCLR